jgi:hypothetical protein
MKAETREIRDTLIVLQVAYIRADYMLNKAYITPQGISVLFPGKYLF